MIQEEPGSAEAPDAFLETSHYPGRDLLLLRPEGKMKPQLGRERGRIPMLLEPSVTTLAHI